MMVPVTSETIWSFDVRSLKLTRRGTGEVYDPNDVLLRNRPDFLRGQYDEIKTFDGNKCSFAYVEWVAQCLFHVSVWFDVQTKVWRLGGAQTGFLASPSGVELDPDYNLDTINVFTRAGVAKEDRIRQSMTDAITRWWCDTVADPQNAERILGSGLIPAGYARLACVQSIQFSSMMYNYRRA